MTVIYLDFHYKTLLVLVDLAYTYQFINVAFPLLNSH